MVRGDLIEWVSSDIRFRGLQDGTLKLILGHACKEFLPSNSLQICAQPNFFDTNPDSTFTDKSIGIDFVAHRYRIWRSGASE